MPPSKEDILLTYLGKRDANRNLSNTPKPDENLVYKATIENYSYKAGKWIVVIVILSFIMTLFAGIGSLILSLFVLAVVFVYYYGIKRSLQNKQSNRTRYYCTNCNHAFVGPKLTVKNVEFSLTVTEICINADAADKHLSEKEKSVHTVKGNYTIK
jgi:flagellar biosynthesis component FlhA